VIEVAEVHGLREDMAPFLALAADPGFQPVVGGIVVESSAEAHQGLLDRYAAGEPMTVRSSRCGGTPLAPRHILASGCLLPRFRPADQHHGRPQLFISQGLASACHRSHRRPLVQAQEMATRDLSRDRPPANRPTGTRPAEAGNWILRRASSLMGVSGIGMRAGRVSRCASWARSRFSGSVHVNL
jgi:hypothetical protein